MTWLLYFLSLICTALWSRSSSFVVHISVRDERRQGEKAHHFEDFVPAARRRGAPVQGRK